MEFNTAAYRFMVFNHPEYRDARWAQDHWEEILSKLVRERKRNGALAKVAEGTDLTSAELVAAMEEVVAGRTRSTGDGPSSLKMKGETPKSGRLDKVMQAHAVAIPTEVQGAMDNCGTGGRSFA